MDGYIVGQACVSMKLVQTGFSSYHMLLMFVVRTGQSMMLVFLSLHHSSASVNTHRLLSNEPD